MWKHVRTSLLVYSGQVSCGSVTGAARRRVHLATELLRPSSGHRILNSLNVLLFDALASEPKLAIVFVPYYLLVSL